MRLILIVILFLNFIFSSVSAQSNDDSGNLIYPYNFNITNTALNNGKIPYNSNDINIINRTITGTFGITVIPLYSTYFSDIQTSIALLNSNNEIIKVTAGPSFNKNDFITNGVFFPSSQVKNFSIEFDAQLQLNPGYKIALLYKYYFNASVGLPNQTTSGWSPKVTHNRDWFYHKNSFSFIDTYIPPIIKTTITGPKTICNVGTYTIENWGTITLENANGIATLTSLGNNQWKITRVGSAIGNVILRSINGSKITDKTISINSELDGVFLGSLNLKQGSYNNSITFTPEIGKDYTNYTWTINSNNITYSTNNNVLTVTIPAGYPFINTTKGDNIEVTLTANGECGQMNKTFLLHISPNNSNYPLLLSDMLLRDGVYYDVAIWYNSNQLHQLTAANLDPSSPKATASHNVTYSYYSNTQVKLSGTLILNDGTVHEINDILNISF